MVRLREHQEDQSVLIVLLSLPALSTYLSQSVPVVLGLHLHFKGEQRCALIKNQTLDLIQQLNIQALSFSICGTLGK